MAFASRWEVVIGRSASSGEGLTGTKGPPRLLAPQAEATPVPKNRFFVGFNISIRHCALRADTPAIWVLASSGLPESCPKIGDVPKSPVHLLAALVPSVGTAILKIYSFAEQAP